MPVSIVQSDTTGWVTASTQTIIPGSSITVGSLIVLILLVNGTDPPAVSQVLFDGVDSGPAADTLNGGSAELGVEVLIWDATVPVSNVRVVLNSGATPYVLFLLEVGDEAHILPYTLTADSADGPTVDPDTPAWTADDDGLVVGLLAVTELVAITEPAGWTSLFYESALQRAVRLAWRATTPGAQIPEAWTSTVAAGSAWVTVVVPFYDVALRLRPAGAFASNGGGNLLVPGPVEPPNPVVPFIAETNPLPPLPSDIEVPLPPWIPQPGPYRDDG